MDAVGKEEFPNVTEGKTYYKVTAEKTEHFTSPPKAFNEDLLLHAMETAGNKEFDEDTEKKGLGTPATRAGIIEKLVSDNYIERKGKTLTVTEDGKALISVMPECLQSASMTAEWENQLLQMEKGQMDPEMFLRGICNLLSVILNGLEELPPEETTRFSNHKSIQMVDHIITGRGNEYYSFHEKDTIPISQNHFTSDIDQLQIGNKVAEEQTGYSTESNPVKNDRVQTTALPVQGKDMNTIMQSLEMGVQNFLEGDQERYKEFLKVMTKFHNYSVNNTLLIAMQRPDATLCNSYKRWQSLGRQVKRGEKGITIIAPAPVKTKQTRERKDQYQQPVIGEDGHPEPEEVEVVIPRFRPTTVFAYE